MSLAHGGYHFDRAVAHAIREWPVMGWQLKPCLLIYPEVPQGQQLQDILHTLHVIKNTALPSFWIFWSWTKSTEAGLLSKSVLNTYRISSRYICESFPQILCTSQTKPQSL